MNHLETLQLNITHYHYKMHPYLRDAKNTGEERIYEIMY